MNAKSSLSLHHGLAGLKSLSPGSVLSIGNFDGFHLGHRRIVERMNALRGNGGARLAVATFEPHPLTVLRPELAPPRLASQEMKQQILAAAGIDDLVILAPTPDVLNLEAAQFWKLLRDETRPAHLVEGSTFTFGRGRGGTMTRLAQWCAGSSVKLHLVESVSVGLLDFTQVIVNSTLIRWLIAHGRARDAAICLGRPYALRGTVVRGFGRGRTIGIPTANVDVRDQLIPADGVYAARCRIETQTHIAALSIGTLPTLGADLPRQVEAYLLDFEGDLYGRVIDIEVLDWIREQRKFDGLESLKVGIARDVHFIRDRVQSS
jgi:riboflavin kinase/FMN adenylyltransferase